MDKKYQVFISSTYNDLIEERSEIAKAILDLEHIPSGMETFFSADEEQMSYIKSIIDQCDYYVLIIAGRYGNMADDGKSYTEKEYDYAVEKGKTILVFLHAEPENIPIKWVESDSERKEKLLRFKERARTGRLVSFWKVREELKSQAITSLTKAFGRYPGTGWVRGNLLASAEVLTQLNSALLENERLRLENSSLQAQNAPLFNDLASLADEVTIRYSWYSYDRYSGGSKNDTVTLSWGTIFVAIAPYLISPTGAPGIGGRLASYINENVARRNNISIFDTDVNMIRAHLQALNLLNVYPAEKIGGGVIEFTQLTRLGNQKMLEMLAQRKQATA
jgi:hypothetical protein